MNIPDNADKVFMHPMKLFELVSAIPVWNRSEEKIEHSTFHGLKLFQDANMPKDEIHFRDKDGRLVGKITGIVV